MRKVTIEIGNVRNSGFRCPAVGIRPDPLRAGAFIPSASQVLALPRQIVATLLVP